MVAKEGLFGEGDKNVPSGQFEEVTVLHWLHLPPQSLQNLEAGVHEQLNSYLLKYSKELSGVPLVYGKVDTRVSKSAPILYDNPCIHLLVRVLWTLFCPHPGTILRGKVNMASRDHLGLLVLGYFNATITANQMAATLEWNEHRERRWNNATEVEEKGKRAQESCWRRRKNGQTISIGDEVEFKVLELLHDGPMMTIVGSLDNLIDINSILTQPTKQSPRKKQKSRTTIPSENPLKAHKGKKPRKHES